jgi:hypothetical protein
MSSDVRTSIAKSNSGSELTSDSMVVWLNWKSPESQTVTMAQSASAQLKARAIGRPSLDDPMNTAGFLTSTFEGQEYHKSRNRRPELASNEVGL